MRIESSIAGALAKRKNDPILKQLKKVGIIDFLVEQRDQRIKPKKANDKKKLGVLK